MASHTPFALRPSFKTSSANEPVVFYSGVVTLAGADFKFEGPGAVSLTWLPHPRLAFSVSGTNFDVRLGAEAKLSFPGWPAIDARVMGISSYVEPGEPGLATRMISGLIERTFAKSIPGKRLKRVTFELANFCNYHGQAIAHGTGERPPVSAGRLALQADGWSVIIDEVLNVSALESQLKASGGFALTHTGELERADGSEFSAEEAGTFLIDLGWLLSFARGGRTFPILLKGFDNSGEEVWNDWSLKTLDPWGSQLGWFPDHEPSSLQCLAPGFLSLRCDPNWRGLLERVLAWYLESDRAPMIESSIVLGQIALEALAWKVVESRNLPVPHRGNKPTAADVVRTMLEHLDVPFPIPSELQHAHRAAKSLRWRDGPQAITWVRNGLAHSKPGHGKAGAATPDLETLADVSNLALWYLELSVLSLCKYKGRVGNRLHPWRSAAQVEAVPWARLPAKPVSS